MNRIKGRGASGWQWNWLLDALVTIIKYNKITIDHAVYIKVFSDVTVYYLSVSADDVINTNNNETVFSELTIDFEEHFEMKVQEIYVLKYLNLIIFQYPFGFSVDQTDQIMELVN